MLEDPVMRLAELRIIEDSADIEAQLANTSGCRPILSMLIMARAEASEAIYALYRTDPEDAKAIRALPNDIARHHNMLRWIHQILPPGPALHPHALPAPPPGVPPAPAPSPHPPR